MVLTLWSSNRNLESLESNKFSDHTYTRKPLSCYRTARTSFEAKGHKTFVPVTKAPSQETNDATAFTSDFQLIHNTPVNKFRWLIWRYIYLKIVNFVSFDVWLLSRLNKYKKYIALLILLYLLTYLLYGSLLNETTSKSILNLSSSAMSSFSYVHAAVSNLATYSKELSPDYFSKEVSCCEKFLSILNALWFACFNFLTNFAVIISDKISAINKSDLGTIKTKSVAKNTELKSTVTEIIEARFYDIVEKIQTAKFELDIKAKKEDSINQMQVEIANLTLDFESLTRYLQKLEKDITEKSDKSSSMLCGISEEQNVHIHPINIKIKDFEEKLLALNSTWKNCYDQKWAVSDFNVLFKEQFLAALKDVLNNSENKNVSSFFFNEYFHSKLEEDKEELSREIKLEFENFMKDVCAMDKKYEERIKAVVENIMQQYLKSLGMNLTTFNEELSHRNLILNYVQKLVKEAIITYDADKTGLVDYALETAGGSVLSTRCSESYFKKGGKLSIFGFPLWTTYNSPRTAIQPSMQPGHCWSFKGSQGFLFIQLAYAIYPTGFTLEHIPVSLSPSGSIDSAPKEFSVWGLISENDMGKFLGKYLYDSEGYPLQYFSVWNTYSEPFSFVELKIHSNHGNSEYTCLYRFRVHGSPKKQ